ncbi:MAG: GNAT family N-acetyltransferase [Actinomycetota bacterium]|nr:GNAT family N-acetyltransferase [Actinomycetota bacterium]
MPRRATEDDADAIADVFLAARADMTYLPELHTEAETRTFIREIVLDRFETWISDDGLGFAALSLDMLEHLYGHPTAQGSGLGSELLDLAKERRPDGFRLWVFQKNEGARRFYERHGLLLVELTDGAGNAELEPDALYEWRGSPA